MDYKDDPWYSENIQNLEEEIGPRAAKAIEGLIRRVVLAERERIDYALRISGTRIAEALWEEQE